MTDFFDRLEMELREASVRPAPRVPYPGAVRVAAVALALLVVAVIPVLLLVNGGGSAERAAQRRAHDKPQPGRSPLPVGTKIRKGQPFPLERMTDTVVVAHGWAPVAGAFQLEISETQGSPRPGAKKNAKRRRLLCLGIYPVRADSPMPAVACGGPAGPGRPARTPDFTRLQVAVPPRPRAKVVIAFGQAPEGAAAITLTAAGGFRKTVHTYEGLKGMRGDFYAIAVSAKLKHARVNWLDASGRPGGQAIPLETDTKGRLG